MTKTWPRVVLTLATICYVVAGIALIARHNLSAAPPAVAKKPATAPVPVQTAPAVGLTLPGRVVSVHDGDTLNVEVRILVNVRLLDCWCPEIGEKDEKLRAISLEGREYIRSLALRKEVLVNVPITDRESVVRSGTSLTFARVLGNIWLADEPNGPDLAARLVQKKLAATEKGKPLGE